MQPPYVVVSHFIADTIQSLLGKQRPEPVDAGAKDHGYTGKD